MKNLTLDFFILIQIFVNSHNLKNYNISKD